MFEEITEEIEEACWKSQKIMFQSILIFLPVTYMYS